MSITTEIQRLQNARVAIRQSIIDKGVPVSSSDGFEEFPNKIAQISTGGTINNYDRTIELTVTDIGVHTYQIPSGYTGHGIITVKIVDSQITLTCNRITVEVDAYGQEFTTNNLALKLYDNNTLLHTWTFVDTHASAGDSATIVSTEDITVINVGILTNNLRLVFEGGVNLSGYDYLTIQNATFFGKNIDVQDSTNRSFAIDNIHSAGSSTSQLVLDFKPQIS